jgi:two-component system, NarL family, nitrate/nitrite response regulator NarP
VVLTSAGRPDGQIDQARAEGAQPHLVRAPGGSTAARRSVLVAPARVRICIVAIGRERLIAEALAALIGKIDRFAVAAVIVGDDTARASVAQNPDLVIARVGAEAAGALELVRSMRSLSPELAIALLADELTSELVRFVLDEGLNALILTNVSAADLAASIDHVTHGRAILPAGWQRALADERDDPLEPLSVRQLEVLELIADGCSYHEIGSRLFISTNTVKFHLRSIYLQLGVNNRMAAARVLARSNHGRRRRAANGSAPTPLAD